MFNTGPIGCCRQCCIWLAHASLKSRERDTVNMNHTSILVTIDILKVSDSLEHCVIIKCLIVHNLAHYIYFCGSILALKVDIFFVSDGTGSTVQLLQFRGALRCSVLSPLLFNIVMNNLPLHRSVSTITYVDDAAFFSCAPNIHEAYECIKTILT